MPAGDKKIYPNRALDRSSIAAKRAVRARAGSDIYPLYCDVDCPWKRAAPARVIAGSVVRNGRTRASERTDDNNSISWILPRAKSRRVSRERRSASVLAPVSRYPIGSGRSPASEINAMPREIMKSFHAGDSNLNERREA